MNTELKRDDKKLKKDDRFCQILKASSKIQLEGPDVWDGSLPSLLKCQPGS